MLGSALTDTRLPSTVSLTVAMTASWSAVPAPAASPRAPALHLLPSHTSAPGGKGGDVMKPRRRSAPGRELVPPAPPPDPDRQPAVAGDITTKGAPSRLAFGA